MKRPAQSGFTLMEVMVTLAIIGILAAIVYPNYVDSVRKNNRASAKAEMASVSQRLQQFYSDGVGAATYTTSLTALGYPSGTLYSPSKGHTITVEAGADGIDSSFTIKATPVADDEACGELTLDHLDTYLPTGC
jgi:type IV pilus assembly protein PilE